VAYFVEEAVKEGHGTRPAARGAVAKWFESLMRSIATALSKLGMRPSALTTDEVVALARGALETSLSRHGEKMSGDKGGLFSRSEEQTAAPRKLRIRPLDAALRIPMQA
jgi:hypothetical protein